jgi:hypothetical protein
MADKFGLKKVRDRKYLNKDFNSLKSDLVGYARQYYKDTVVDFSESSLSGMLVEFAAYVGDTMSFYLDHQFSELNPNTAVETANIENHIKNSGIEIVGASPAVVNQSFYIEVPTKVVNGEYLPDDAYFPVIEDAVVQSNSGIDYVLKDRVDFSEKDKNGNYKNVIKINQTTNSGIPLTFLIKKEGICVSGKITSETFSFSQFVPFNKVYLSNSNVTEIISVSDNYGNEYYEVGSLSQDVVFKRIKNSSADAADVPEVMKIIPAPYRYTSEVLLSDRTTTLTFGGGDASTFEDDVIPDPSEFSLPIYGKKTIKRINLDPNKLLKTKTLGVIPSSVTLTVQYQYGGGLDHNSASGTIKSIKSVSLSFPNTSNSTISAQVRSTLSTQNNEPAEGGEDSLSVDDIRSLIPSAKNSQSRMITRDDIVSRVYRMPSNFGRVFRVSSRPNENNPLSSLLYVVSRDSDGNLMMSPDTLKDNLKTYLNEYRLTSEGIDIVDSPIVNLKLNFDVTIEKTSNKKIVLQNILSKLRKFFDIKNFQIDQAIILSEVRAVIFGVQGVVSINSLEFKNLSGQQASKNYSSYGFNVQKNTVKDIIVPPPGGIFEIKFLNTDIEGQVS